MSKKISSTSDNKGHTKSTCTKFHEKILNRYQEKYVHRKHCLSVVTIRVMPRKLYKMSWENIEWFSRNKVTENTDKQNA